MEFKSEEVQSKTLNQYFGEDSNNQSEPEIQTENGVVELPPEEEDFEEPEMPQDNELFNEEPCAPQEEKKNNRIPLFGDLSRREPRKSNSYIYALMAGGLLFKLLQK